MNIQYYNSESFVNDFIYPKELYALINLRISYDLKNYELIVHEDNRVLINSKTFDWAFHTRNNKGFWNKKILGGTFDVFSIDDSEVQSFLALNWFSNLIKEELNELLDDKILLEDSFSNRSMLVKQMLNVADRKEVLKDDCVYMKKEYWLSKKVFETLSKTKFFKFI